MPTKRIEQIRRMFEENARAFHVPGIGVEDLLDLEDFYMRSGQTFEADLCQFVLENTYPDDVEVRLNKVHSLLDEGDIKTCNEVYDELSLDDKYESALIEAEPNVRTLAVEDAEATIKAAIPKKCHREDYDFIFDAALLMRDYGCFSSAVELLNLIPQTYKEYTLVAQTLADCYTLLGYMEKSKRTLEEQLDSSAFNATLWTKLAQNFYRLRDFTSAIDACEYALAIGKSADATRLKRLASAATAKKIEDYYDIVREAEAEQDWKFFLALGEFEMQRKNYSGAAAFFESTCLYCPRQSEERLRALGLWAVSLFAMGKHEEQAYIIICSLSAFGHNNWDYYVQAAEVCLERKDMVYASFCLRLAITTELTTPQRVDQLCLLLSHYSCYKDFKHIWRYLIALSTSSGSYASIISAAKSALGMKQD